MDIDISRKPPLASAVALLAAADLPTQDLTERHCENFFYLGAAHQPEGLVGVELFGESGLLRSLVVSVARRSGGSGTRLLRHAEDHARARGTHRLYLLTTTAEEFFARRGYERAARDAAPAAIRATPEFAGICPASSAFMVKTL